VRKVLSIVCAASTAPLFGQSPAPSATPTASPAPTASPTATPSPTPELTTREIIDRLSDSQLDQAMQNLRATFLDPSRTDERQLRLATLEGLLARLSPGLAITSAAAVQQPAKGSGFLAEILDDRIGYARIGALTKDALAQLDTALANFREKKLRSVILDLRGAPPSTDYELAAEFARRFCPKGALLFNVQKPSARQERILTSSQDPAFSGVLVVLTDKMTSGGCEALAATLRKNANAMIVGARTRGEAVEFSDVPLGDGRLLRVAIAQVTLPGADPIFPDGVRPDIAAALPLDVQERIFALSKEKGVSQFVFETERPHFNEAALVTNTNPEIGPNTDEDDDEVWDTALQRAVDLVTAIGFYDKQPAR
jgi:hypothetical protein